MKKTASVLAVGALIASMAVPAAAQNDAWKREMERKLDILTREIEGAKMGEAAMPEYKVEKGFGPAASKVYRHGRGLSIAGYGEMVYSRFDNEKDDGTPSGKTDQTDFLRYITYFGYKFSDKILLNSEIEFEHASTGKSGSASVEFAYLDFLLHRNLGVRTGLLLVPVGIVNELHEPPIFHGANRPNVEKNVLPTTWRENGAGVFGGFGPFEYKSYVLNGQDASNFSASSGIRGGRQKGSKAKSEDLAWVARLDYTGLPGFVFGASFYNGDSGQGMTQGGRTVNGALTIWDLHAWGAWRGLEAKALYTELTLADAGLISAANGTTVGSKMFGGYAELAFDFLSLVGSKQYFAPFARYERYDTQLEVPAAFAKSPANSRVEYTLGATYKPIPEVVVKGDWQDFDNQAGTGVNQVNLAVGYLF